MQVFYDPVDNNQVQAIYSGDTNSTAWAAFQKIEVTDLSLESLIRSYGRDCRLTMVANEVAAVTQFNHPFDHSLSNEKTKRKSIVDVRTKDLISLAYCDNGYAAAIAAITTIVDAGQSLKGSIDSAVDQSALDAIVDAR